MRASVALAPIRRPGARRGRRTASSAPASTSTGIVEAVQPSHDGSCAPVPACSRLDGSPATVFSQPLGPEGSLGREPGEQRLGQPVVEERLRPVGSSRAAVARSC